MAAELFVINNVHPDMNVIIRMANALRNGKLVILPTETVYGIAANADNPETIKRLNEIKDRGSDSPFTVHLHSIEQLRDFVPNVPKTAEILADKYWPGPLTLVFPKIGKQGLGVRVVNSPITQQILKYAEVPIVMTSANLKGGKPATSGFEANQKLANHVDYIVEAGFSQLQESSSVILMGNQTYKVKRDTLIGKNNLEKTLKRKIYVLCDANRIRSVMAQAFLRKMIAEEGEKLFGKDYEPILQVESAGLFAVTGEQMLESTAKVLSERDAMKYVEKHRAKAFNKLMFEDADEIFVMTKKHVKQAKDYLPEQAHKIKLLHPDNKNINDPIRKSVSVHRKVADVIMHALTDRFFSA